MVARHSAILKSAIDFCFGNGHTYCRLSIQRTRLVFLKLEKCENRLDSVGKWLLNLFMINYILIVKFFGLREISRSLYWIVPVFVPTDAPALCEPWEVGISPGFCWQWVDDFFHDYLYLDCSCFLYWFVIIRPEPSWPSESYYRIVDVEIWMCWICFHGFVVLLIW